ncbi:hypothetical protein BGZ82_001168 [Podila clonocystis]|nr:hypothetical protein BGZ82_001168 [Podila clonocystis]
MSLFKISKSSNKAAGASKLISSAQSTPRSSVSLDGPSTRTQSKSSSSANEGQCKIYPTKFLYEKYAPMIQERLASLPASDRNRVTPKVSWILGSLRGDNGVIAESIFSVFHKGCRDRPPRRSPDEVCGSAKSIACFAPWGHKQSVFDSAHAAVVKALGRAFEGESGNVQQALVTDIREACPSQCGGWVAP